MKDFFKDLKDPKFWASVCAWMVPISIGILWISGSYKCWSISEIGTIIAAIAGPFAGLAGFLYIYASLKVQTKTLKLQQRQIHKHQEYYFENSFQNLLINYRQLVNIQSLEESGKRLYEVFDTIYTVEVQPGAHGWTSKPMPLQNSKSITIFDYSTKSTNLKAKDRENILLGFRQLLHILNFIQDELNSSKHYHETFLRYLSHMEKFSYFYFFLMFQEDHTEREKKLLRAFFKNPDKSYLHKEWHSEWIDK